MTYSPEFTEFLEDLIEEVKTRDGQHVQPEIRTHVENHTFREMCSRCGTEYDSFGKNMFAFQCSGCEIYMFLAGASVLYSSEPFLYKKQSSPLSDEDHMSLITRMQFSLEDLLSRVQKDLSDLKDRVDAIDQRHPDNLHN